MLSSSALGTALSPALFGPTLSRPSFLPLQPLNTLFMHFFVAVDEYATGCLKEIIR